LPAGGLAIIDPGDSDVARVLLARHLVDWPADEPSMLVPRPEGWIAILAAPDTSRRTRWAQALPDGEATIVLRDVELARIAARVAMLEAGAGRVPPWMVEGFAEAALGLVALEQGEPAEAAALLERARRLLVDAGDAVYVAVVDVRLGLVAVAHGQVAPQDLSGFPRDRFQELVERVRDCRAAARRQ
jgi:hypothetical protein